MALILKGFPIRDLKFTPIRPYKCFLHLRKPSAREFLIIMKGLVALILKGFHEFAMGFADFLFKSIMGFADFLFKSIHTLILNL